MLFLLFHTTLSCIATWMLFKHPYLKLTNLGWLLGIWLLPVVGACFYMLTVVGSISSGRSRHLENLRTTRVDNPHTYQQPAQIDSKLKKYNELGEKFRFLTYSNMHSSEILVNQEFVPAVLKAINSAKQRVWICSYIFTGEVKETVLKALQAAHERGVDVRLVIDRFGSELMFLSKARELWLREYDFPIFVFRESTLKSWLYIEKRLHAKLILVDENTAFVGSHNLRDAVQRTDEKLVENFSLKFKGSVVKQLSAIFSDLWFYNVDSDEKMDELHARCVAYSEDSAPYPEQKPQVPARIIFSEPLARSGLYKGYLLTLLASAERRIYIWMPYIIPNSAMRALIIAQQNLGVEVKIIFPANSDSFLVDHSHKLVLKEFVDAGVSCVRKHGCFDHSKILIVDDLVQIGSANLDYRSLYRNYESNIEVLDPDFAEIWQQRFIQKYEISEKVTDYRQSAGGRIASHMLSVVAGLY